MGMLAVGSIGCTAEENSAIIYTKKKSRERPIEAGSILQNGVEGSRNVRWWYILEGSVALGWTRALPSQQITFHVGLIGCKQLDGSWCGRLAWCA